MKIGAWDAEFKLESIRPEGAFYSVMFRNLNTADHMAGGLYRILTDILVAYGIGPSSRKEFVGDGWANVFATGQSDFQFRVTFEDARGDLFATPCSITRNPSHGGVGIVVSWADCEAINSRTEPRVFRFNEVMRLADIFYADAADSRFTCVQCSKVVLPLWGINTFRVYIPDTKMVLNVNAPLKTKRRIYALTRRGKSCSWCLDCALKIPPDLRRGDVASYLAFTERRGKEPPSAYPRGGIPTSVDWYRPGIGELYSKIRGRRVAVPEPTSSPSDSEGS